MSVITAAAVGLSLSSAHALAQADQRDLGAEIADEQQARNYAIEMVSTNFPASQAAAEEVLRGGQEELSAYTKSGMDEARTQDLRQIVVTISSLSEENVQNAAKQALDAGDIDSLSDFIDTGWQTAQTEDDRATAWKATQAPEGSVLKAAAEKALSTDTEEALSEFASTGADKARWDDKRREVYELSRSPLPSVAAGASEALMTDTDTAIESYLRYGQFVDAAQDSEKMSITELVDTAIEESDKAQRAASFAATNADQARRATEASRQATQKAKDEALAADAAQVRAGNAAASAGKLANQSAQVADNAVAAAAEARQALAQTADALARAASAASRARIAAQEAAIKSIEAINLANDIAKLSQEAATQRQEQEAQYLKDQAVYARELEDAQDKVVHDNKEEKQRLQADLTELASLTQVPEESIDTAKVQQLTVSALQVGDSMVQGGAQVALQTGSHEDLLAFVKSFDSLKYQDNVTKAQFLWQADPNPEIRKAADEHIEDPPAELDTFLNETVHTMKVPELTRQAWQLRDAGGNTVKEKADAAISSGTYDDLVDFVVEGGFEKARYEDQQRQAYELARTGGPELKASAEAAVLGDRAMLNEFVSVEAFRKSGDDAERTVYNDSIDALLQQGFSAAQKASENAAKAQQSYYAAYGDSVKARDYANQASQWAGKAAQSARIAQDHVRNAENSLRFALAQKERAHAAANQAEADARQAGANADAATSYALQAHQSASDAASSAATARQSANQAGYDAQRAGQAAQEAYDAAIQKQLAEEAELQEASMAGAGDNAPTSVLDAIKETIGKEALNILLDFIGVTDVINCFKGEISGCLWTALSFIPGGAIVKFGKGLKAASAIRKLLAKLPDVKKLLSVRKQQKADRLIAGLSKPGKCGITLATSRQQPTYSFAIHRPTHNKTKAHIQPAISRCGGYPRTFTVHQLDIHTLTPDELNVFMKWDRTTPLSDIKASEIMAFGYKTKETQVIAAISSLQDKVANSVIQVPVTQPHILNKIGLRNAPKPLDLHKRTVGKTSAQNQFAQMQALFAQKRGASAARLNQRDVDFVYDEKLDKKVLKTLSRGRPDVNIVDSSGRSIKTEFDRPPAPRAFHHARQLLDANPNADVWLLTLDDIDESDDLMKVITANRNAVDSYNP